MELEEEYSALLRKQRASLERTAIEIKTLFTDYAGQLLGERCELAFTTETRSIGQSGEQFEFPRFEVLMTSGVFAKPSERRGITDVSESQREFIDLAFRMALMSVASGKQTNAMLVLETPEASLDSLFVERAGTLLRKFASGGGNRGNLLIATSNLNNENMIPSLLGAAKASTRKTTAALDSRIPNLLVEVAPNAALRENRRYFETQIKKSLAPRASTSGEDF